MKIIGYNRRIFLVAACTVAVALMPQRLHPAPPDQVLFPGQAEPEISSGFLSAYEHALSREYGRAREICAKLTRDFPNNPTGPTGEMVLYQVMMLENDDFEFDAEFRLAAGRVEAAAKHFAENAPKNDWYYTLLGAAYGIEGIYYLRRDEYLNAFTPGVKGLYYMQAAAKMNPENWEARMGIGLFLYYRSAFARYFPVPWAQDREKGMAEVEAAGQNRSYLREVSRIALFYIYMNEKNYDRSRSYMDGLIAKRPSYPVFYQLAGWSMTAKGDYKAAYNYYMKMHRIDPKLYLPYYKLGQCAMRMERKEEAKKWLTQFFRVLGDRESRHKKNARKYLDELSKSN